MNLIISYGEVAVFAINEIFGLSFAVIFIHDFRKEIIISISSKIRWILISGEKCAQPLIIAYTAIGLSRILHLSYPC